MGKRAFDLIAGTVLLIVAVPIILILALALAADLRAFPFFVQRRIGRHGVEIGFLKLRTLPVDTPRYALKTTLTGVHLSPLRAFLRRSHLDELPQLLHVLTGDLSLVGPRPRMPEEHEPVDPHYARRRVEVPQGCTGLWQIGTHADDVPDAHPEYDLFYVEHATLRMDLWILWCTLLQVVGLQRGVTLAEIPAAVVRTPAVRVRRRLPSLRVPALAGVPGFLPPAAAQAPGASATASTTGAVERVIDLTDRPSSVDSPALRVVIAHDYVTQKGGAERVVLGLLEAFPNSRLVTSIFEPSTTFPEFGAVDVETFGLNRSRLLRSDPRRAFPLLARAWENHVISDADVVICSSSGWSHGVTTAAPKVVYCHNPARWLYQPEDYLAGAGRATRLARNLLADPLIRWDRRAAESASAYIANSSVVAGRVLATYSRDCEVIAPPIGLDADGEQEAVPGLEPGFLLTVSRARGYKNVELVCEAVEQMTDERLVALGDLPETADGRTWDPRLRGVGRVSDAQLRWLYANCKAVVSASHEDFGLTPLEGNLFGRPAVVLRAGGFLDTVIDQMTGSFIEDETVAAVAAAIRRIPATNPTYLRAYALGFRQEVFAQRMRDVVGQVLGGQVVAVPPAPAEAGRRLAPVQAA